MPRKKPPPVPPVKGGVIPPSSKRPLTPPLLNPRRENGSPLSLDEVKAIGDTYAVLRSENATSKALGVSRNTVRLYLHRGDPSRGIAPLLGGMPPAPPPAPKPAPPPPPDPMKLAAFADPVQGPDAPVQAPAAPVPSIAPPPGVGAPQPPLTAPADPVVAQVGHTVTVANNELVRLSRNTRGLYDLRQRVLTRVLHTTNAKVQSGEKAPKLSQGDRELLMLCREARIRPVEMLALHRVEVGILGTVEGKAAADNITPTDESQSIEDLQNELRGLLDERKNLLTDDGVGPTTSNRGED